MKVVAYVSDELSVKRSLDPLGLSSPRQEKPPRVRETCPVLVDDEGREIEIG